MRILAGVWAVFILSGCRDAVRGEGATLARADDVAMTRAAYAWVGKEHNRMLDEFRKEMRKPGRLRDVCRFGGREVPEVVLKGTTLCGDRGKARRARGAKAVFAPEPSALAYEIVEEAKAAVDAASGPSDLAARLALLYGKAALLEASEQEIIAATLSVAQSSFEYWSTQLPAYVREIDAEYGDCIRQQVSFEDGLDACVRDGGVLPTVFVRPASWAASPMRCSSLGDTYRSIGKADLSGAFIGGIFGGLGGALAGAATRSMIESVEETVRNLRTC